MSLWIWAGGIEAGEGRGEEEVGSWQWQLAVAVGNGHKIEEEKLERVGSRRKGILLFFEKMKGGFRNLKVYQMAFSFSMEIFEVTKRFPLEEKYALTDQIRRSSKSIFRAIGEGYRKRQYPKNFASKISDGDMENTETQ